MSVTQLGCRDLLELSCLASGKLSFKVESKETINKLSQKSALMGLQVVPFVNNSTFSASTIKLIFTVLKSALRCAENKRFVENIWSKVKLLKNEKSEIIILTPQEQYRLESVLSEKNDIGILICLYTGLRIGELCALKWSNIDFNNGLLYVDGTQSRINSELKITPPNSKAPNRVIPIPDVLIEKLKTYKL